MKKRMIIIAICFIQGHFVFSQDYIITSSGENLTVNFIAIDSARVQFKLFDNVDSTKYFIAKQNIVAIGFASNMLKRMKDVSFKNEPAYKPVNQAITPDHIYPQEGEPVNALIDLFTEDQVQFHLAFTRDTNTYFLKKSEISEITFKEISNKPKGEENLSDMELVAQARVDAQQNYNGYHAAAVGSFVAGFAFILVVPIVVPIVLSVNPPLDENLGMIDPKLMKKPVYSDAYIKTAITIKSNKVWSNFGYGALTLIGTYVGIGILVLSTLR